MFLLPAGEMPPLISGAVQIVALFGGFWLAYFLITRALKFLDKKIPSIELQEGWIRYLLDGPKSVLVIGLVSVLFGVLIINTDASNKNIAIKLAGIIFTEFGFAFFIAFILHNTIEMHSKVERDRQMSRGILSYLYGVRLDDKMFRVAEEYIFKSPFYRRNMRVEYEFVSRKSEAVLLKHSLEYVVFNISDREKIFSVQTMVEKSDRVCGSFDNFPHGLGLYRIAINGNNLTAEEINAARAVEQGDNNFISSSHLLTIAAGASASIKTVSFLEKCDRDSEFWRSLVPADGLEVRFVWRPELGLEVMVDVIHPSGSFDRIPHSESGLVEAKLSQPLFPYNGFLFWWSPERSQASSSASVSADPATVPADNREPCVGGVVNVVASQQSGA